MTASNQWVCSDCSRPISCQSKKGRCRSCAVAAMNADPVYCANRARGNRERMKNPNYRARLTRQIVEAGRKARTCPDFRERLAEIGRQNIKTCFTPEARARWKASRAKAAQKRTNTMLSWCPEEYRDEYRRLRRSGSMTAADARKAIEAKLTPFERKLLAVANGAALIEMPARPARQYDYTLGGVVGELG